MKQRRAYQPPSTSANWQTYAGAFVRNVYELLALGYARLSPTGFADAQEEEITGALAEAIDKVLDDPAAPEWVSLYSLHEEPPIHDRKRKGRRRRRLDLRIDSSELRPRHRFPFEAKPLGRNHRVGVYLGLKGLGRFVDGRYGRDSASGGMLGYVQDGEPNVWAGKIGAAMCRRAADLHVAGGCSWQRETIIPQLQHTYRSMHRRPSVGASITIYHCLLQFN